MNCPRCNAQVPKGVVFCPVCGDKVIKHLSSEAAALASLEVVPLKAAQPAAPVEATTPTESTVTTEPTAPAESTAVAESTGPVESTVAAESTGSLAITGAPKSVRPKSRKEKKALRARLRTIAIAYKQGTLQRVSPRLHVHDNNESAQAAPVQSVTDLLDRYMLRQQIIRGALTALVVLCLVGIVSLVLPRGFFGGIPVPDVRGRSAADATAILRDKGFEVAVQNAYVDDSAGLVIATDPNPDKLQGLGKTVTLTVGELRHIPSIQGVNYKQALKKLHEYGYQNVHVTGVDSPSDTDVVVGIDPAANSMAQKDQPVTLTLKRAAS